LLPSDFDSRYNQSAPQDQQTEDLQGGEVVTLTGLCPEGVAQFYIPRMHVVIKYFYQRETVANMLRLDTVLIEPDKSSVTFTWRAAMITKRRRGMLREILVYTES
jgi:hypothetical protein